MWSIYLIEVSGIDGLCQHTSFLFYFLSKRNGGTDLFFHFSRSSWPSKFHPSFDFLFDFVHKSGTASQLSPLERFMDQLPFSRRNGFFYPSCIAFRPFFLTVGKAKVAGIIIQPLFFTVADLDAVTGPSVVSGIRNDSRPHWIKLHISATSQEILDGADRT